MKKTAAILTSILFIGAAAFAQVNLKDTAREENQKAR